MAAGNGPAPPRLPPERLQRSSLASRLPTRVPDHPSSASAMRKAINENPTVQIALVAGLLLVAALMLFMGPLKKKERAAVTTAGAAPSARPRATSSPAAPPPRPATPRPRRRLPRRRPPASPTAPNAGTVSPEALDPRPRPAARGRPGVGPRRRDRAADRQGGRAGTTNWCRRSVNSLSEPGVSVFVAPASKVARYSRITQGVGVNRVPALVVVRPEASAEQLRRRS